MATNAVPPFLQPYFSPLKPENTVCLVSRPSFASVVDQPVGKLMTIGCDGGASAVQRIGPSVPLRSRNVVASACGLANSAEMP